MKSKIIFIFAYILIPHILILLFVNFFGNTTGYYKSIFNLLSVQAISIFMMYKYKDGFEPFLNSERKFGVNLGIFTFIIAIQVIAGTLMCMIRV